MNSSPQRILIALSGGVDSAVASYLLKEKGYQVEAVYVRTWENEKDALGDCPGAKDLADAREIAKFLEIPFHVVNFIDFYHQEIVRPMIHHLITSNEINQQHIPTHLDHCLEKWI